MNPCTGICDRVTNPDKFCRNCGRNYDDIDGWDGLQLAEQVEKTSEAVVRLNHYLEESKN